MSHQTRITAPPEDRTGFIPEFASILIVDDQRFDRSQLKKLCRAFNFSTHVIEADSLMALRDKLRKDRFDLILIDYHLTDGSGLEGVEIIRADPVNCHAATVMITGTEQTEIAVQAMKVGFTDYLTKDELSAQTLTRAATSALQKSQMARGLSLQTAPPIPMNGTIQSFSRECARDIKPIVSRIMRQMRRLREFDQLEPEDAIERVEQVEGSLRRLWAFLDDLDQLGGRKPEQSDGPTIATTHGAPASSAAVINARVPTVRPQKPSPKTSRPPSIFRRRPD
jgi:CheY-like chemotaxis protein